MPWASRFVDRLSHRFLVPRYAARADAIIAVSEMTRSHVLQYLPVPPDRVSRCTPGWMTCSAGRSMSHGWLAVRAKYALPERFLLYAGAIYPPKNFTRLVRAYARVGPERGIPLVIAGGENRFLSEHELKEPEALGIGEWVRWPGWVEQEELAAFYMLADALLLPSLFESCGLPVLEAMAAGCPVVTADRYGTKELAEGAARAGRSGETSSSIAAGIRRVLEDTALRERLITAGQERSRHFTWDRCARETLGDAGAGRSRTPAGESVARRSRRRRRGRERGSRLGQPGRAAGQRAPSRRPAHRHRSVHGAAARGPGAVPARSSITALTLGAPRSGPAGAARESCRPAAPSSAPGALGSLRAMLWKTLVRSVGRPPCACARPAAMLFHGMDGFLPYSLRRRDRCVATVHDLGWQVHPELYPGQAAGDVRCALSLGRSGAPIVSSRSRVTRPTI